MSTAASVSYSYFVRKVPSQIWDERVKSLLVKQHELAIVRSSGLNLEALFYSRPTNIPKLAPRKNYIDRLRMAAGIKPHTLCLGT